MENTIPDLQGPIQQTWSHTVKATYSAHKRVMRQKKVVYKHWQRTRASEGLAAHGSSKKLAKAIVGKAKDTEMDALYEKLHVRKGDQLVFRSAKVRQPATQYISAIKAVEDSDGVAVKPAEVGVGGKNSSGNGTSPRLRTFALQHAANLF
uniref:Endonuclease-reverse transcriptase HmRTE-e01 n=1 Tax=Haemonchus contortus TaxID=6289 RepID=W6NDF2_HAECO